MLLLAVVAVIAVVWLLIAQPWRGGADTAAPTPDASTPGASTAPPATTDPTPTDATPAAESPAPTEASAPAPSASPALAACAAKDVRVEALTDQNTYAAGVDPQFSIRLTNTSGSDCTMNVGTATQSFTVTSGTDVYWRSTDCQTAPSDQYVTLAAGQTVTSATPITWDRTRSSVDTCGSGNRPAAPAGGASYHLAVAIGGVSSAQTAQFLLY